MPDLDIRAKYLRTFKIKYMGKAKGYGFSTNFLGMA